MDFLLSTNFWVGIVIAGLLLGGGTTLLRVIRANKGRSVTEDDVFNALLPFIYQAIFAGEHYARTSLEEIGVALDSIDRKTVADTIYDALPSALPIAGISIPINIIKFVVTRERFETLVEDVYGEAKAFILKNDAFIRDQVDALRPTNESGMEG